MKLCCSDCTPCCDFCEHAEHYYVEHTGKQIPVAVKGCKLHKDEEHQLIAQSCSFCDDFFCMDAEDDD